MKKFFSSNEQILPRPPEKLPPYADARARLNLAEKLVSAFMTRRDQTSARSPSTLPPGTAMRSALGPSFWSPIARRTAEGSTTALAKASAAASDRLPNPGNPRTLPNRRHPFAVDPGSAGEDSRFRPIPEPRSPANVPDTSPELVVEIDSREHLEWASANAAAYVLGENDWRKSIKAQGVMEAVWLACCTFTHLDGSASVTVPN